DDDLRENELEILTQSANLDVVGVRAIAEALDRCAQARPDVVVIDLRLPDGDGVRLARELRQRLGSAGPALVFTSAYPEEIGRISEAIDERAAPPEVLSKPFSPALLIS